MANKIVQQEQAIELIENGMSFSDWMQACKGAGIDTATLQNWPAWKAAGMISMTLRKVDGKHVLTVAREG